MSFRDTLTHEEHAADGTLWRALGTCGVVFAGAVCASLAIRCFKTNE